KLPAFFGRLYTLLVVLIGWVLFRFRQLPLCGVVAAGLFGGNGNPPVSFETGTMWLNYCFFLPLALLAVTPAVPAMRHWLEQCADRSRFGEAVLATVQIAAPVVLLLLSTMALVGNSYNPFLYFQF
ncbi:MAG: MBOAT family protein, partial [Clostridia bacterium]|nr:MBOAT family protein [Clostridia bacterium]